MSVQTFQQARPENPGIGPGGKTGFPGLILSMLRGLSHGQENSHIAYYALKQSRANKASSERDILPSLPLAEKQSLGMHKFVD